MKRRLVLLVLALVTTLAGCSSGSYIVSDVTRFHTLPPQPAAQSFLIQPLDDEQKSSLAFRHYAELIAEDLRGMGLRQSDSADPAAADYVVTLSYSVQGPETEIRIGDGGSRFAFGMGYQHWGHPWGWGSSWTYGYPGYADPFYDPYYARTRQLYVRRIELDMYSGGSFATPSRERVFEARALSTGNNGDINPVMPYVLHAIFDQFPGVSGQTMRVRVKTPDGSVTTRTRRDVKSDARWQR